MHKWLQWVTAYSCFAKLLIVCIKYNQQRKVAACRLLRFVTPLEANGQGLH